MDALQKMRADFFLRAQEHVDAAEEKTQFSEDFLERHDSVCLCCCIACNSALSAYESELKRGA